ncbi:MAG TPA: thioredoxin TrxC [Deltaproteobacteria bacterium]|nr:thioredoxin TrxC [Deltaproteobacteria bacterium]
MSDSLHIVCPHCAAVNRIPSQRMGEGPRCGKCHQALFTGQPVELDAARFEKHITRNDIPVVVDFWAPWCAPCRAMAPEYEKAAGELEPDVRLAKVDTEAEQAIGSRFGIRSIPTLAIFRGGSEIARQAGAMPSADIIRWVKSQV